MYSLKRILIVCVMLIAPLMFFGCLIEEVVQPLEVNAGSEFTATLTISEMTAETGTPHKGALLVLVPEDWTFLSGTYDSPVGTGDMELNPDEQPLYGDIDTTLPPPLGMKWVELLSDEGYLHDANVVHDVTVTFQVGQTIGVFQIGYASTKNTLDMLGSINPEDVDNDAAWTDTSMNHLVTVMPTTSIEETMLSGMPSEYKLAQNYPNPFNPTTTINFSVMESSNVRLALYDVTGREINVLVDGFKNAGNYSINFSAEGLSSGIYYYRIFMNGFSQTHKMILMK